MQKSATMKSSKAIKHILEKFFIDDITPIKDSFMQSYIGETKEKIENEYPQYHEIRDLDNNTLLYIEVRFNEATHIFCMKDNCCTGVLTFPD